MTREEFVSLIGQDVVVDYDFGREVQKWSMLNFYIDDNGEIKHNRIHGMIVDVFIKGAYNPHVGDATHG